MHYEPGEHADPQAFRAFIAEHVANARDALADSLSAAAQGDDAELAASFRAGWAYMQAARDTFRDLRSALDASAAP